MSALSHQSAINGSKNFWLSTDGNGTLPYNQAINFTESTDGSLVGQIKGTLDSLYIESPHSISFSLPNTSVATTVINTDSTEQNGLPGIYTSTSLLVGDKVILGGDNPSGIPLTMFQKTLENNVLQTWNFQLPQNLSTMSLLSYQSKDDFNYNSITTPVWNIDPYSVPTPTFSIPTYNTNIQSLTVSSINGAYIPPNFSLQTATLAFNLPIPLPQGPNVVATTVIPDLVANGVYQYDVSVVLTGATFADAGTPPTIPFNINFAVRLGGATGTYDYGSTYSCMSPSASFAGTISFNLSGMATAGSTDSQIDIIAYNPQTGTTMTLYFTTPADGVLIRRIQ